MTKSSHRKNRYCLDCGEKCRGERCGACIKAAEERVGGRVDHVLDQKTEDDFGRNDNGRVRKGLGVSDPRDSDLVKYWNWELQGELGLYQAVSQTSSVDVPKACKKANLTGPQTEAVLMFCEGLSLQQIAVEVGVARESIHDRLKAARKKMRAYFDRTPLDTLSLNTPQ